MDWLNVKSTTITRVKYNSDTKTLYVEAHGGRIQRFYDVPQELFQELVNAKSHGQFLLERIIGKYRCV